MTNMLKWYLRFLETVDRVVSVVVTVAMAVLTAVVILQVVFRYGFNQSLSWGWDVPRLCFIWVVLLAIPLAFRYNAHVTIDTLFERFSASGKRILRRVNALFMLILCGVTAFYAVNLMEQTWDQMMPGINLSTGLFYLGLLIGQVHCCLHIIRLLMTGENTDEVLIEI